MSRTLDDRRRATAELQRELDECRAERDEALAQQAAIAEILQVINSSPGDLAPVFDAMVEKAIRLCDSALGVLSTFADGYVTHRAYFGPDEAADYFLKRPPTRPGPGTVLDRLLAGENPVQVLDAAAEESYRQGVPARRATVDLAKARSILGIALHKDGKVVGAFSIIRQEVRPFTDKQIALVQNFAAQAVIAIENARLITETREALEQQTATAEVLGVINSSPGDLAPVFDAMLEKALRVCEANFGNMFLYEGGKDRSVAVRGAPEFARWMADRGAVQPAAGSLGDRLMRGEDVVHIINAAKEAAYESSATRRAVVEIGGFHTLLAIALRRGNAALGGIVVYRKEFRPFTDKQIALLQNFAAQAVIAMENARLITETREALEQQTATAEVLGVINSSPGDLAPVFDAMLEKAMRLCTAAFGYLMTYDSKRFDPVAWRGLPARFADYLPRMDQPGSSGAYARIIGGEPLVHIADLMEGEVYRTSPLRQALVDLGGARTGLIVALRKDERLLGVFTLYRQEVRPFSEKQIGLLQNFAQQAVIAMENARLLGELRQRTEEVADLNRGLEARVAEQVEELGRVGRLKRFLAPQLAELIVSQGDEKILESHRREIVVVFCDLRGYTAFTETAEPEEVLDFLREYHGALGPLVSQYEGTLDQFSGDGIMVFFNDPVPCLNPAERAVKMAMAMREEAGSLIAAWRERGRDLGFGSGIAQGYATLGQIGFSERSGYTAIGTVCNVAARLCAEAKDGQILLSQRVNVALNGSVVTEQVGALALKGLTQPVVAFNVPLTPSQPALRVIEGGPQNV